MNALQRHISQYLPLGSDTLQWAGQSFEQVILPKNEWLVREGAVCRHLYFVESGALRGYYNWEGKEQTYWFGFENDFVTSFHSFTSQTPALENIQLLEGSVLWRISRERLDQLMDRSHEAERIVRKAYENYYVRLEERFVKAQFTSAAEKYQHLLEHHPRILERVPLGMVASFLGISAETLSRIRARL